MKHGHSFAIALLALALAACGGSGSKGGNTDPQPVGLTDVPRIEAVLDDPSTDPGFPYQDPLNLQTGDRVRFQLVNYTNGGSDRNVLAADLFSTTDSTNAAGQLSPNLGLFQAGNFDTGSRQFIVGARYEGITYTAYYKINPRQIRLRGKVLTQGTGAPVYNAEIDFYGRRNPADPSSAQQIIASVHTAFDGTFRVSLPAFNDNVDTYDEAIAAAPITFTVSNGRDLPKGYYPSFKYQGQQYDAGSTVCRAPLLSTDVVTDPNSGQTAFLPFKTGDRYLVTQSDDADAAGVIQLAPKTAAQPATTGCNLGQ